MRLGDFIEQNMEQILGRWEAFAGTRLPAAQHMTSRALRDHGEEILQAIVADLATPQTPEEQAAKSMGLAPVPYDAPRTAAQTHAVLRAESGFDIEQLASEYRALRASVLASWVEACQPEPPHVEDMIRFNEAIDQALAESISFFSAHVTRARNLLLGMLSHDLRSPLHTILMTARALHALKSDELGEAAERLIRSGARMQRLLDDLIDFNRTELGLGIRIAAREADLAEICAEEVDLIRATWPDREIRFEVSGDCHGRWDAGRIQQLVNNLVINALQYGAPDEAIRVAVECVENEIRLTVTNRGPSLDRQTLRQLFEPLRRGSQDDDANRTGLGLGLYIASEIARAHGGVVEATSEGEETTFRVRLPRG